jgi:methylmalonyl-CoA/ethylmalonyl-CoA epimerase
MTLIRRLDHVAVAVADTDAAVGYFRDRLGLEAVSSEVLKSPNVRLTYLDVGNAYIQLVEPLDGESEIARYVASQGEGIHHICFGVDDVPQAAAALAEPGATAVRVGSGRGRVSAFVPGPQPHGLRVECTEFSRHDDVETKQGWLP